MNKKQIDADLAALRNCLYSGQQSKAKSAAQDAFERLRACCIGNHATDPERLAQAWEEGWNQAAAELQNRSATVANPYRETPELGAPGIGRDPGE